MRAPFVLAGVLASLVIGGGGALAQDASPAPATPAATPIAPPFDDTTAVAITPMPGAIVEPQPIGWDHVTIQPDGRTLTVFFWNGPDVCFGLDRVELVEVDGALRITPWVGFREDAADKRCTADLVLQSTMLLLETPILGGGLPGAAGARGTTPIVPGAALMAVEPQPWTLVDVAADGATLLVSFSGGVAECHGLGRVDTPIVDGLQLVVIQSGHLADPAGGQTVCESSAVGYYTPIMLVEPLLLGGAA